MKTALAALVVALAAPFVAFAAPVAPDFVVAQIEQDCEEAVADDDQATDSEENCIAEAEKS
ncbi:hypothetical protein [Synechococcus sp. UW105]|jgi:hypothetical protein|uniref:hypothetical protein n=1 Tax=unclassified Synechococcus TaxID=2626047 RepID=UPI000E0F4A6D|nr:hypothetical protein [Synechococcus sp. UW105]